MLFQTCAMQGGGEKRKSESQSTNSFKRDLLSSKYFCNVWVEMGKKKLDCLRANWNNLPFTYIYGQRFHLKKKRMVSRLRVKVSRIMDHKNGIQEITTV